MTRCFERIERMVAVEQEYRAGRVAMGLLFGSLQKDPSFLNAYGLRRRDAERYGSYLETTYLVRLFAEFEAGLRDVWLNSFRRRTRPNMAPLLRAVSAIRAIPQSELDAADRVRLYRNVLVHEGDPGIVEAVTLEESRTYLCRYFRRMPLNW